MSDSKKLFLKGNEAACHGALSAGCRCFFGYPITPQNDIPELLSKLLPEAGGEFVQAESEVASINMLLGAAAAGIRAFTSSSSPGMSLMQEGLSYMAGSELPGVVVNMNRGGPGLGDIGPSQGDYFQSTRGGGHGDYRTPTLAPASCQEVYDMMIKAFDLAFLYRNPVLILADAIIGQMKEPVTVWKPEPVAAAEGADWSLSGAKGRPERLLKSLFLDDGALAGQNRRLQEKYARMTAEVDVELFECADAELIVVAYGSIARIVKSTIRGLRKQGKKIGLFRPKMLYPWPSAQLRTLAGGGRKFLCVEHNCGQMVEDARLALCGAADCGFFGMYPGELPSPDDFVQALLGALKG